MRLHHVLLIDLLPLLAAIGLARDANAQPSPTVTQAQYCVPKVAPSLASFQAAPTQPFSKSGITCDQPQLLPPSPDAAGLAAPLGDGDYLVVYVNDGSQTLATSSVTDITYTVGKNSPTSCINGNQSLLGQYFIICKIAPPDSAKARDQIIAKLTVTGATQPNFGYSLLRVGTFLSYAGSAAGFWIPVGLFGTTFQSNADGITLAALPVGIAWGGQLYPFHNNTDYIGLSGFASWTISPQKSSSSANNGNYTIADLSPGALFDLDGYAYAGAAYTIDFRTGYSSPGFLAVLGLGPKLLTFLKAESTTTTVAPSTKASPQLAR
jgi:hypothetical protein